MEVSKSQAFRAGIVHQAREARKRDIADNTAILAQREEDKKAALKAAFHKSKKDHRRRDELERAEKARLADLMNWKETRALRADMEGREREAMEKIRLQEMSDAKEHSEILRRIREEARMRYLEERRRFIENKDVWAEERAKEELDAKRAKFKMDSKMMQIRIRGGNFLKKGHNGGLSYYDDIRAKPVDWVRTGVTALAWLSVV